MKKIFTILLLACSANAANAERWLTLATDWPVFEASIDPATLRLDGVYRYVRLRIALLRPGTIAAHPEFRLPEPNMRDIEIPEFRANCRGRSYLAGPSVVHRLDGGKVAGTQAGISGALVNHLGNDLVKRICELDPKRATQPLIKMTQSSTQQEAYFADPASAWRTGGTVTMWYLMDFAQPRPIQVGPQVNSTMNSMRVQAEFNCTEQEFRILMMVPMTGHQGQGDIVEASKQPSEWQAVGVSGTGGDMLAAACDKP